MYCHRRQHVMESHSMLDVHACASLATAGAAVCSVAYVFGHNWPNLPIVGFIGGLIGKIVLFWSCWCSLCFTCSNVRVEFSIVETIFAESTIFWWIVGEMIFALCDFHTFCCCKMNSWCFITCCIAIDVISFALWWFLGSIHVRLPCDSGRYRFQILGRAGCRWSPAVDTCSRGERM